MPLPSFIVVGAAKSGTTTLWGELDLHPGVCMSPTKEPEYFCRDTNYSLGEQWYKKLFDRARPGQAVGEASTMYSNCVEFPDTVSRMYSLLPDVKIVYMVREPVARAYSYWLQMLKNQNNFGGNLEVSRDFNVALEQFNPITSISNYPLQLKQYLRRYPRESVHIIVFEEYVQDRMRSLTDLSAFLEIDPAQFRSQDAVWKNRSSDHFAMRAKVDLAVELKKNRVVREARKFVPKRGRDLVLRAAASLLLPQDFAPRPMSDAAKAKLQQDLKHVREWLEEYLGRTISAWDQV